MSRRMFCLAACLALSGWFAVPGGTVRAAAGVVLGSSDTMEKVFRDEPWRRPSATALFLEAARNEVEGIRARGGRGQKRRRAGRHPADQRPLQRDRQHPRGRECRLVSRGLRGDRETGLPCPPGGLVARSAPACPLLRRCSGSGATVVDQCTGADRRPARPLPWDGHLEERRPAGTRAPIGGPRLGLHHGPPAAPGHLLPASARGLAEVLSAAGCAHRIVRAVDRFLRGPSPQCAAL